VKPKLVLKSLVFSLIFSLLMGAIKPVSSAPYPPNNQSEYTGEEGAAKACAVVLVGLVIFLGGVYLVEKIRGPIPPSAVPPSVSTPEVPDDEPQGSTYD